jgi:predicted class III extradiol MEMO1 family dioxygenase
MALKRVECGWLTTYEIELISSCSLPTVFIVSDISRLRISAVGCIVPHSSRSYHTPTSALRFDELESRNIRRLVSLCLQAFW